MTAPVLDPTSQPNYTGIATTHASLDWTIDFEKRCISGSVTHRLTAKEAASVGEVIFDTYALEIVSAGVDGRAVETRLDSMHKVMGSALHVLIPIKRAGETVSVKFKYRTTEECSAPDVARERTEGKRFQYLFSQCPPRSLAPLQDTPSAKLESLPQLEAALLSAQRISPPSDGPPHGGRVIGRDAVTYHFKQDILIPPYF